MQDAGSGANGNQGRKSTFALRFGSLQQRLKVTVLFPHVPADFFEEAPDCTWQTDGLKPLLAQLLPVSLLEICNALPQNAEKCNSCPWVLGL